MYIHYVYNIYMYYVRISVYVNSLYHSTRTDMKFMAKLTRETRDPSMCIYIYNYLTRSIQRFADSIKIDNNYSKLIFC